MHLETVRYLEEFTNLGTEWNDLLECCSASHVPFLRHEYLVTWWNTLGGGEWQGAELNIVTARDNDGGLIGAAPLFFTRNLENKPSYMLLGSIEISDYLDFLVKQGYISADEYLADIELGNEIVNGYGQTVIDGFEVSECD